MQQSMTAELLGLDNALLTGIPLTEDLEATHTCVGLLLSATIEKEVFDG